MAGRCGAANLVARFANPRCGQGAVVHGGAHEFTDPSWCLDAVGARRSGTLHGADTGIFVSQADGGDDGSLRAPRYDAGGSDRHSAKAKLAASTAFRIESFPRSGPFCPG